MRIVNDSKRPQKPQILLQPGDVVDVPDHVAQYLLGFSSAFKEYEEPASVAPAPEAEPEPEPTPAPKKASGARKTAKKQTD